jgi:hypothetical protein
MPQPSDTEQQYPAMTVHLSDPVSRDRLVEHLAESGCIPSPVGETTLEVVHPEAHDADEARLELVFFLRAWQRANPEVELHYVAA